MVPVLHEYRLLDRNALTNKKNQRDFVYNAATTNFNTENAETNKPAPIA